MTKRVLFSALAGVLIFGGGQLFAQSTATKPQQTPVAQRGQFVDTNKDGVCDNFVLRGQGRGWGRGGGGQFVDDNKNNVCDFYENRSNNAQRIGRARGGNGLGPCNTTIGRRGQGFGRGQQGRGMGGMQPAAPQQVNPQTDKAQ